MKLVSKETLEDLRRSVGFTVKELRAELDGLSASAFPGDSRTPHYWLDLAHGWLDTAENYIKASIDEQGPVWDFAQDNNPPLTHKQLIEFAATFNRFAYDLRLYLRGSTLDDLPFWIVPPLERWFNDFNIRGKPIFRTQASSSYELRSVDFNDPLVPELSINNSFAAAPSLIRAKEVVIDGVHFVSVPSRLYGPLPRTSIVAHELGHAILQQNLDDLKSSIKNLARDNGIEKEYLALSNMPSAPCFKRLWYKCDWIEEIIADSFAFALAGPAFLFAMYDLHCLSPDPRLERRNYKSHPPIEWRIKWLLKHMRQPATPASFSEIAADKIQRQIGRDLVPEPEAGETILQLVGIQNPIVSQAFEFVKPIGSVNAEEAVKILSTVVEIIHQAVTAFLTEKYPGSVYTQGRFSNDLDDFLEPLLWLIPPIERVAQESYRPAELTTILNVGWISMFVSDQKFAFELPKNEYGDERLPLLHGLLLKALELSEIRRFWGSL